MLMWDWLKREQHAGLTGRDVWLRSGLREQRARRALCDLLADGHAERYRRGSAEAMGRYYWRLSEAGLSEVGPR